MYALIKNNKIVKIFTNPESFEHEGNKYSSQIFTLWSKQEKQSIGILEIETDSTNLKDDAYYINSDEQWKIENNKVIRYWNTATPKQLEDVNAVDEKGKPIIQDGKQVIIKGLKSQKIQIVKQQTAGLLQSTDWYVVRKSDTGTAIPANIQEYRNQVREVSNQQEEQINACLNVDELKSLYEYKNTGTEQSPIYTRQLVEFPRGN